MGFTYASPPQPALDVARRRIEEIRAQLAHTSERLTSADVADPRVTRAIDEAADVARSIEAARHAVARDSVTP
jgi:hypothetical protein